MPGPQSGMAKCHGLRTGSGCGLCIRPKPRRSLVVNLIWNTFRDVTKNIEKQSIGFCGSDEIMNSHSCSTNQVELNPHVCSLFFQRADMYSYNIIAHPQSFFSARHLWPVCLSDVATRQYWSEHHGFWQNVEIPDVSCRLGNTWDNQCKVLRYRSIAEASTRTAVLCVEASATFSNTPRLTLHMKQQTLPAQFALNGHHEITNTASLCRITGGPGSVLGPCTGATARGVGIAGRSRLWMLGMLVESPRGGGVERGTATVAWSTGCGLREGDGLWYLGLQRSSKMLQRWLVSSY